MNALIVFGEVLVAVFAVPSPYLVQQEWNLFKSEHNKVYENYAEEVKRLAIFHENLIKIEEHNQLYEQGLVTYKFGVTPFADMTVEEFLVYVNSSRPPIDTHGEKIIVSTENLRGSLDWRDMGVVSPVKDQGACKSGWAFSAVGALESQHALKLGNLTRLSEQQLVDCSGGKYGNQGCNGGWMVNAFRYVKDRGIATEASYPYKRCQNWRCQYNGKSFLNVTGYYTFYSSIKNIQSACAQYGPISVALDATFILQFYKGGILVDSLCSSTRLNHGVLLVGYGKDYWLLKNSWGAKWGEAGYFRLSNTRNGCGITTTASLPVVTH